MGELILKAVLFAISSKLVIILNLLLKIYLTYYPMKAYS